MPNCGLGIYPKDKDQLNFWLPVSIFKLNNLHLFTIDFVVKMFVRISGRLMKQSGVISEVYLSSEFRMLWLKPELKLLYINILYYHTVSLLFSFQQTGFTSGQLVSSPRENKKSPPALISAGEAEKPGKWSYCIPPSKAIRLWQKPNLAEHGSCWMLVWIQMLKLRYHKLTDQIPFCVSKICWFWKRLI